MGHRDRSEQHQAAVGGSLSAGIERTESEARSGAGATAGSVTGSVAGAGNPTLLSITSHLGSFTKSEKRVAETVLHDPEAAVYTSITDMAEKAGVGETSVLRFCRKLGFQGYQEFKLSVAQHLSSPAFQVLGEIEESDSAEDVLSKLTAINAQAIQDSAALIDLGAVQQAADMLLAARTIWFLGIGTSGLSALDAKHRLLRLGIHVQAETDTHLMKMQAAMATPQDVVVGLSVSGSTRDLVDALQLAKSNGVRTVCLTGHAKSPITRVSDVVLLTASKEAPLAGGSFSAKLSQLHAIDVLSTILALRLQDSAFAALEKTAKSVLDKLY
ncbi:MurR/RpiR family transcriptional regulator [Paenibacillus koleovorans]|uniref:MurR/RpiR family transcriptional regulator n=1 Tax=Paenibacillus koleovorans TaxID=121608 RepID=UPI000FD84B34|nr:MurR/RpiR family transcriptional regulator [Paenibacillus koleovorans]